MRLGMRKDIKEKNKNKAPTFAFYFSHILKV